jgi:hypothetical protein
VLTPPGPFPNIKLDKDSTEKYLKQFVQHIMLFPYLSKEIVVMCRKLVFQSGRVVDLQKYFEKTMIAELHKFCDNPANQSMQDLGKIVDFASTPTQLAYQGALTRPAIINMLRILSDKVTNVNIHLVLQAIMGLLGSSEKFLIGKKQAENEKQYFVNVQMFKKNLKNLLKKPPIAAVYGTMLQHFIEIVGKLENLEKTARKELQNEPETSAQEALEQKRIMKIAAREKEFDDFLMKINRNEYNENLNISLENPKDKAEIFFKYAIFDHYMTAKYAFILKSLPQLVPNGAKFRDEVIKICERNFHNQMSGVEFLDSVIIATANFIGFLAINKVISLEKLDEFEAMVGHVFSGDDNTVYLSMDRFHQASYIVNNLKT